MADSPITFSKRLWIIEDDESCRFVYDEILGIRHSIRFFRSLGEFKECLARTEEAEPRPDLFIADLRLPDGSFLNFLSSESKSDLLNIPVLVVSSVDDIDALRLCFDEGAIDYLTKPFRKAELVVKIERILSESSSVLRKVPKIDVNDRFWDLTVKERQIMTLFMESRDRIITRSDLHKTIWKDIKVHPKNTDVHIYNLRRKLAPRGLEITLDGSGRWKLTTSKK